jgi:hypothetical protein
MSHLEIALRRLAEFDEAFTRLEARVTELESSLSSKTGAKPVHPVTVEIPEEASTEVKHAETPKPKPPGKAASSTT